MVLHQKQRELNCADGKNLPEQFTIFPAGFCIVLWKTEREYWNYSHMIMADHDSYSIVVLKGAKLCQISFPQE